jgi:predicted NBD/HSP70 family sugar kinase
MTEADPSTRHEATLNAQAIRLSHRAKVLREIWEHRAVSRADVARTTGFSRSTVSDIVTELLAAELVVETHRGASRGGRRPILLELRAQSRMMVGIEVGGGHVSCVLIDLRGQVLHHQAQDHDTREDPEGTLRIIQRMIDACLAQSDVRSRLLGIGVALPSPVEPGTSRTLPLILPRWEGVELGPALSAKYGVPVLADNDANAGIRAEARWGAARGIDNAAFIKVATGIGAGFLLDGRLFRGQRGFAGEIGHMSIDSSGPPCVCGINGCLNVVIGTPPLLDRCRVRRLRYPNSRLHDRELSIQSLVEAALDDDPLACEVVAYAGSTLGIGISNVLNLLNLERIILGGRLTRAGDRFLQPLQASLRQRALSPAVAECTVVVSEFPHAVAVGAACLVLEAALRNDGLSLFPKESSAA